MEEEFKPIICMICLNVKSYQNCAVMKDSIKNALDLLLLKLPVEETNKSMICDACYAKLCEAVQFKTICIDTEDTVIPYVNLKNGIPINLKQIYLKKNDKEQLKSVLENERICRLCLQKMTSGFTSIEDISSIEVDLIRIYIPEVNFKYTADPVVCSNCLESLKMHGGFLRNCLDIQKFENVCEDKAMHSKPDITGIKVEEIEIKTEEGDRDIETPVLPDEPADCKFKLKEDPNTPPLEPQKYECNMCSYRTNIKYCFSSHQLKHKTLSEVVTYRCDVCEFQTKYKVNLASHQLKHKGSSETQMYSCHSCDYATKYKRNLLGHQLKHKDASETQIYKCDVCTFGTKRKEALVRHRLLHKDTSQVPMYKCDSCCFETRHKVSLTRHGLMHKDISQVQTYKCDLCPFETRYKKNVEKHRLVHKVVPRYKCDACCFETKCKEYLVSHQLKHKDISEMQMYKCDVCNFETKRKGYLVRHQLVHRNVSEMQVYKCHVCSYETKRKAHLSRHMLKHRNALNVQLSSE